MHQNIKLNHIKQLDSKLYHAHYYDFMIYNGNVYGQSLNDIESMAIADFSQLSIASGVLYSTVLWSGATNSGVEMNNVGLTGVDNGLITYRRDAITNEEFLKIYLESQIKIDEGDTRLFLTPVDGNTQMYKYPLYLTENDEGEKYISCKGGFYQGFFKLDGFDYQVLPNTLDNEWLMHFEIRPRTDYTTDLGTVNYTHPSNSGIFFFMGTRAENKFWPFYKTNKEMMDSMKVQDAQSEGYFDGCGEEGYMYNVNDSGVISSEWVGNEPKHQHKEKPTVTVEDAYFKGDGYFMFNNVISEALSATTPDKIIVTAEADDTDVVMPSDKFLNIYGFNYGACGCVQCGEKEESEDTPSKECHKCKRYFNDDYFNSLRPEEFNNKFVVDEYIGKDIDIKTDVYEDTDGHSLTKRGYYEIETDNKFLMFDSTPNGFNVNNWVEGTKVTLTGRKDWPSANYFLLMNRTPTGYTVDTIDQYNEANAYDYNIYKDLRGNVFALRVREDGAIGYRYGVYNCEAENKFELIEEYSLPNLVKADQWNSINVRFSVINPATDKCDTRNRKMKMYFYVNGFLVFISKEVDAFKFKSLDEVSQKQETVPYNISLGGGSMGLMETIVPNYYAITEYVLPIEKDFCGTFLGDIKSFKMYDGFINYSAINDYLS